MREMPGILVRMDKRLARSGSVAIRSYQFWRCEIVGQVRVSNFKKTHYQITQLDGRDLTRG